MKKLPLIFFFISTLVVCAAVLAGATSEPQWYTLQISSYDNEKEAQLLFQRLLGQLPENARPELRIEEIGAYFTVRIGKFTRKEEAELLEKSLRPLHYKPAILQAYLRRERIREQASGSVLTPAPLAEPSRPALEADKGTPLPATATPPPAAPSKPSNIPEPLYYTIQLNTFPSAKEADKLFAEVEKKLPPLLRPTLRVERISANFTVRVGQAESRQELQELFSEVQKLVVNPLILQAYLRPARVVKSYTPTGAPPPPPLPAETPLLAERLDDTPSSTPSKSFPPAPPKIPEPAPADPPAGAIPSPPEAVPAAPVPPVKPPGIQPGTKEYQERILAKYLNSAQAGKEKERQAAKAKAEPIAVTPTCLASDCHARLAEAKPGHYPANSGRCPACHQVPAEAPVGAGHGKFPLLAQGGALCARCHAEVARGKVLHPPAKEGDCLHCHNPHGTNFPALLAVGQTNQEKLCLECHEGKIMSAKFQHGPVGLGICTYCHSSHGSEERGLLRQPVEELCLGCHSDFRKNLAESTVIHTPLKKQSCVTCHAPHGSPFPHLLAEAGQSFCFTCHRELEEKIDKARSKHAALGLNQQCATCHLPHFSPNKFLLVKKEKSLCLSCHGNNVSMPPYKPSNIEKLLEGKEYIHAPVAAGECSTCHSPHGTPNLKLLVGKYPASFYAAYEAEEYALCFTCHPTELLTAVETSSETAFRNGKKNLHFTHVGMERKGRTCQACHAVHASDGPKLINRTGAPFGSWTMSVDFFVTNNGGNCTPSCHREMVYDRDKPVDYQKKEKGFGKYFIDYKSIK